MKILLVLAMMFAFAIKAETITHTYIENKLKEAHMLSELCLIEIEQQEDGGYCKTFQAMNITESDWKRAKAIVYDAYIAGNITNRELLYIQVLAYRTRLNKQSISRYQI